MALTPPPDPEQGDDILPWARWVTQTLRQIIPRPSADIFPNVGSAGTTFALRRRRAASEGGSASRGTPFQLIDASTEDGCFLKVSLNSWLSKSERPDDHQTIVGLGVPFAIALNQWIYLEVEWDGEEIAGATIAQDDWDSETWSGDDVEFAVAWDDDDADNRRQTKARRLIGFTRAHEEEDYYPVDRMTITGGSGEDAVSMQVVQSLNSHLLLCEGCFDSKTGGPFTGRLLRDYAHVPFISPTI
jgi:hypothetical protein